MTMNSVSRNADLTDFVFSTATLTPAFSQSTLSYISRVPNSTSLITVTPTVSDHTATVKVNTTTVASDSSITSALSVGVNTIITVVTAQDGTTTVTYTENVMWLTNSESWRQLWFGTTANIGAAADSADQDHDGFTNAQDYILGTSPTAPQSALLMSALHGTTFTLTFLAKQATGPGYHGLTRSYTLETTTDLSNATLWAGVAGYINMVGSDKTVTALIPIGFARSYYRLKVILQ